MCILGPKEFYIFKKMWKWLNLGLEMMNNYQKCHLEAFRVFSKKNLNKSLFFLKVIFFFSFLDFGTNVKMGEFWIENDKQLSGMWFGSISRMSKIIKNKFHFWTCTIRKMCTYWAQEAGPKKLGQEVLQFSD